MKAFIAIAVLVLVATSASAQNKDNKSLNQLREGTSGKTTGQTFDGGRTPTDTTPRGNVNVPPVSGRPVDTSTGTAGGYDVNTSTGTATGGKRKGTEKTN